MGMVQSEEDFTKTRERKPLKTKTPTVCNSDGESIVPVRQTRKRRAHTCRPLACGHKLTKRQLKNALPDSNWTCPPDLNQEVHSRSIL